MPASTVMRQVRHCMLGVVVLIALSAPAAHSCTIFSLTNDGRVVVGDNFDFILGDCYLLVNKRGIAKTALSVAADAAPPPAWTARYGSVTFNWWGREFPFSGMNEAGLTVCSSGLSTTAYPGPCGKPVLFAAQLVQYVLDNCKNVPEALDLTAGLDIAPPLGATGRLHYYLCDVAGTAAVAAYQGGRLTVYRGTSLPVPVLTNTAYDRCLVFLQQDTLPNPDPIRSVERFIQTGRQLAGLNKIKAGDPVTRAFAVLARSAMGEVSVEDGFPVRSLIATEWSIVFDVSGRSIFFHTFENRKVRSLNFRGLDFSCSATALFFDIQTDTAGDISARLAACTPERNRAFFKAPQPIIPQFGPSPQEAFQQLVGYPETLQCTE